MKNKVIITDNFFDKYCLKNLQEKADLGKFENQWFNMDKPETYTCNIVNTGADHFPIAGIVGYEVWAHDNTRPVSDEYYDWHYDKDEYRWSLNQVLRFPIFSAVFYLKANCFGGQLLLENGIQIEPVVNRLVLFEAGIKHRVRKFKGTRYSLNINPWRRKLER